MIFSIPLYCETKESYHSIDIDFIESKSLQHITYIRNFNCCTDRLDGTCKIGKCPAYEMIPYNCDKEFFNKFT